MPLKLDYLRACSHIANLTNWLEGKGITVCVEDDFDLFLEAVEASEKETLFPMFDPSVSDICASNGFWIHGTDKDGKTVHLQAARVDELNGISLAEYLESLEAYYAFPQLFRREGEYCLSPSTATKKMTGRIVYQGEFWLKGGAGGVRGQRFPAPLMQLSSSIALLRWNPDYTYAMVQPRIVRTGMAKQYGYASMEPHGILWHRPYVPEFLDEWVIWRSRRELIQQVCSN